MSQFNRSETNRDGFLRQDTRGQWYADYKCHEELRRLLTPNGKMYGRKRLNLTASEQRRVAQAIKRARHMALLPFTSASRSCSSTRPTRGKAERAWPSSRKSASSTFLHCRLPQARSRRSPPRTPSPRKNQKRRRHFPTLCRSSWKSSSSESKS